MKAVPSESLVALGLAAFTMGCGQAPEASRAALASVVERDGVAFAGQAIPGDLLEFVSPYRVVVVGEHHQLREHFELLAELVRAQHAAGLRQVLLEWPHALDWLLRDYVEDRGLEPNWEPSRFLGGAMIEAVRDFNRSLPADERIRVRAIDVNLAEYEAGLFVTSLRALAKHLPEPEPVEAFLQGYSTDAAGQRGWLESFRDELAGRRSELVDAWGEYWYATVAEMVEVEVVGVGVVGLRNDHYDLSVRLRENAMKRLVDLRLQGEGQRTLINVGANHAQKAYLKGTSQEWLGDYLVHVSAAAAGSVIVLEVSFARGEPGTGGAAADFDLLDASPQNELFRLMNETWPDRRVFLPLEDPIFLSDGVPLNFEGEIYVCAPRDHYDAFILLPVAHHVLAE